MAKLVVIVVAVSVYVDRYAIFVAVGPLSVQREPVVVTADVYQISAKKRYLVPLVTEKDSPVQSCSVLAVALLLMTSDPSVTRVR